MFAFPLIYSIFQLVVAGVAVGSKMKLLFTLHLSIRNMRGDCGDKHACYDFEELIIPYHKPLYVFLVHYSVKRCRQKKSADEDGEGTHSTVEDQNKQNYALENGGFHCDENGNSEDKDKGTKL